MVSWNELPAREDGDENAWEEYDEELRAAYRREQLDQDVSPAPMGLGIPREYRIPKEYR